jgi:hypothetical protein
MNEDFKLLLDAKSGLNDVFSGLAYNIEFFRRNKLNHENLHFTSRYGDLNEFFNIKDIKYIEKPNRNDYNFISTICIGGETNLNYSNQYHISNFIKVKDEIKKDFKSYEDYIAIHFRFMDLENGKSIEDSELNLYVKTFFDRYRKNEKYVIFSDSTIIGNKINIENNIELVLPEANINAGDYGGKFEKRKQFLHKSISDLYSMSTCKVIYRTKGMFVNSTKLFNKNSIIRNFLD